MKHFCSTLEKNNVLLQELFKRQGVDNPAFVLGDIEEDECNDNSKMLSGQLSGPRLKRMVASEETYSENDSCDGCSLDGRDRSVDG